MNSDMETFSHNLTNKWSRRMARKSAFLLSVVTISFNYLSNDSYSDI